MQMSKYWGAATPLSFIAPSDMTHHITPLAHGDNVSNCKQAPQLTNNAGKLARFANAPLCQMKNAGRLEGTKGSGIVRACL
jgi:hypothetical protein